MAVTKARSGFGTLFQRGDGATPEVFTTIAEVMDVEGPEKKVNFDDATHMESPDQYAEFIPTMKESGSVTFNVSFLPDDGTHASLNTDLEAMTKRNFRIVLPSATKRWEFTGFVEILGASHPVKGKMVRAVSIKVTGKPNLVANT